MLSSRPFSELIWHDRTEAYEESGTKLFSEYRTDSHLELPLPMLGAIAVA